VRDGSIRTWWHRTANMVRDEPHLVQHRRRWQRGAPVSARESSPIGSRMVRRKRRRWTSDSVAYTHLHCHELCVLLGTRTEPDDGVGVGTSIASKHGYSTDPGSLWVRQCGDKRARCRARRPGSCPRSICGCEAVDEHERGCSRATRRLHVPYGSGASPTITWNPLIPGIVRTLLLSVT